MDKNPADDFVRLKRKTCQKFWNNFLVFTFDVSRSLRWGEDPFPWQHLIKNSDCLFRFFFFQEGFNENPSVSVSPPFYPFFSSYKQSFFSLTFFSLLLLLLLLLCPSVVDFFATYHWQTHHLSLSPPLFLPSFPLPHSHIHTHTHTHVHAHTRTGTHAREKITKGTTSFEFWCGWEKLTSRISDEVSMKRNCLWWWWRQKNCRCWKWFFGGPCTLQLLTGGIQCWYRMMVLNERIKRGWSRTKLVLSVLISSQLRFWIFSVLLAFLKLMPAQTGFSIGARRPSGLDYRLLI